MPTRASDLARLCGLKESSWDDREVWHFSTLPVGLRVRTRQPLAAVGLLDHPDLVPDEPARIEFIVRSPDPASGVAVDRVGLGIIADNIVNIGRVLEKQAAR